MSEIALLIADLAKAGLSPDLLGRVAQAISDASAARETEAPKRSAAAERTARWRAKKEAAASPNVTGDVTETRHEPSRGDVTNHHKPSPGDALACVRDNPSRLVISGQTVVDVSASALEQPDDWPTGSPVDALVAEIASPRLDPAKAQGLVLTSGRLAAWRRDGASWEFDVVPVVRAASAKAKTPIASWKYFDAAIAQSIADNRRALEIPEATPLRAGGPVVSFADKIGADNAEARRRAFELLDAREARNG